MTLKPHKLNEKKYSQFSQLIKNSQPYLRNMGSKTPNKKPRNGKLNPEQKRENRSLAQVKIKVEHIIRFLKIFRILSSPYKN